MYYGVLNLLHNNLSEAIRMEEKVKIPLVMDTIKINGTYYSKESYESQLLQQNDYKSQILVYDQGAIINNLGRVSSTINEFV